MRTILALALTLVTVSALAQSEFGRASGGTISGVTKAPSGISGSLTLSQSTGARRGQGYEATLGGEVLNDRLWFFGAASILPRVQFSNASANFSAFDAKVTAQPVDWTNVSASFTRLQQPVFGMTTMQPYDGTVPSSFLSLRSTSMLSDRMSLDFSFSATR